MHNRRSPKRCRICHGLGPFKITKPRIAGGRIYRCCKCKGYFLHPAVTVDYQESEWSHNRELHWESLVQVGYQLAPRIVAAATADLQRPIKSILEVGCSSAYMAPGFVHAGVEYTGIDVDLSLIRFAQRNGINAVCVPVERLSESAPGQARYDLVISSNVLEHVADPVKAFRAIALACDGVLIAIVPNPHGLFHRLKSNRLFRRLSQKILRNDRNIAYSIDGYWHNVAYSAKTLAYLATVADLEIVRISTIRINDPIFGFVQRNRSPIYVSAEFIANLMRMNSQLLLVARPRATVNH